MAQAQDELKGATEIIPDLLYFQCLQQPFAAVTSPIAATNTCYYLDNDLIYEPFCADFGPCNLAHTYRFCQRVNQLLQQVRWQWRAAGEGGEGSLSRGSGGGGSDAGAAGWGRHAGERRIRGSETLLRARLIPLTE